MIPYGSTRKVENMSVDPTALIDYGEKGSAEYLKRLISCVRQPKTIQFVRLEDKPKPLSEQELRFVRHFERDQISDRDERLFRLFARSVPFEDLVLIESECPDLLLDEQKFYMEVIRNNAPKYAPSYMGD